MKVGFIGTGNMGGALARAAAKAQGAELLLANRTRSKAEALAAELGAAVAGNREIAETADYIFLGVKPQGLPELMAEIAPVLRARQEKGERFLLVSMAAGTAIARVQALAGGAFPVIRIMPNTPAAIGEGVTLFAPSEDVTEEETARFTALLSGAGALVPLPENLIDAGSAVSGCGPAYVYLFIEALADGGVRCGLPRDKAQVLAAQTLAGAAKLVLSTGTHPGALKDAVCSPGGTTIEGVRALEKGAFRSTVMEAVIAAYEKNAALG